MRSNTLCFCLIVLLAGTAEARGWRRPARQRAFQIQQATVVQPDRQPQPSVPLGSAEKPTNLEADWLTAINRERSRFRLPALVLDNSLIGSAKKHSVWMAVNRILRHTTLPVAENIASGQRTLAEAVQSWMNSPGHRANILNPRYTRTGVSVQIARDGTAYWCQQFR
jgi:uncharacterized protein YkwD